MSDKFTIKFKGILDHAATKKAIEQDISKMEKYLKPKKSSLGSTKDIVKNNLSDKKKELNRQSKFESLRERVEKYRLSQTKKLMKQGMGFEKARKEAFKRSLMSDRDKRRLEYKELAKESKAKSKMLAASQGKGLVAKIAIGSALGNIIGNAMSKVGGGLIGFLYGFMKKSVENESKQKKLQQLNNVFYSDKERNKIWNAIKEMKGFERNLEKEDLLRTASVLKGHIRELKLNDEEGENVLNATKLAAMFRSTGLVGDNESAVEVVSKILKGELTEAFNILKPIDKFGEKYLEAMKNKLEFLTQEGGKKKLRPEIIADLIKDISSLKIMGHSDELSSAKSKLDKIEQSLEKTTSKVLMPVIGKITDIIDNVMDFDFNKIIEKVVDGIRDGLSGALNGIKNAASSAINTAKENLNKAWEYLTGKGNNNTGGDDLGNFK
ncbi:DUF759 family protein [Borreliella burgdorferi]|uniref:DUF759 family protein n=2 Tax=Borreliella burgdorferi TaxID=139 RepID=UPI00017F30AA|nr:DUF759 family protein [Borreliella burgdorferi]ACN55362.1 conserved hypothetical protein [Borreliella burgdorferi WI91-23]MCD2375745.1 DUF759 family protein [Borreliella burgdorferi]MCD2413736.1 DUF759 family protein [Borreliella burgdorferi]PRQ90751.1 hypothetical protein CV691_06120 [Borreliella burgdorferi]PRR23437.1 hypothetical protein CV641_05945 [Borreliella burgdorferi]